jgi:DNA-binding NarL/FixJ family response regulator
VNEQKTGSRVRLLLLASQALFRASLGRFLAAEPNLEVVAECGDAVAALALLATSAVDVVLVDCDNGSQMRDRFLAEARNNGYDGRFLVIASTVDLSNTSAALRLGASGIFLKSEAPDRLVQAINLVANGAVWLEQSIVRQLADHSMESFESPEDREVGDSLSDRELRVLQGIVSGLTNKKIGESLGLSEGSVKTSVQQLFHRAGVRRRSQLVRVAMEGTLGAPKSPIARVPV